MKSSLLIGFLGGIVVGLLQYWTFIRSMHADFTGTFDIIFFYSPLIVYFMCIYMSIKIYARTQPNPIPDFKGCLKAGGITMLIIVLLWWIAIFVALTHTDVRALVNYTIQQGQKENVPLILANFSKQGIFDHSKFLTLPNFLLGFVMTVLVTIVFRLRRKPA